MKEKEMNILRSEVIAFTDKAFKNELEEIYSLNIEQSDKELLESVLNTNSVDIKKLLTHMIRILDVYRRSANSIEKSNNLMFGLNTEISDSLKQIREIEYRVNVEKIKEEYDNIEVLSDKINDLNSLHEKRMIEIDEIYQKESDYIQSLSRKHFEKMNEETKKYEKKLTKTALISSLRQFTSFAIPFFVLIILVTVSGISVGEMIKSVGIATNMIIDGLSEFVKSIFEPSILFIF